MSTITVDDLLARNKASLASFQPRSFLAEGLTPPSTLLVTCSDPRVHPEEFFGLKPAEVGVTRIAGGRVRVVLKEIVMLDTFFTSLGFGIKNLVIVHHTDCGGSHSTDEEARAGIIARCVEILHVAAKWASL